MTVVQLQEGFRAFVRVGDLDRALEFYRDVMGLPVERVIDNEYVDFPGWSLTVGNEAPLEFHVEDFERAADSLEAAGVEVIREGSKAGKVKDPFGNLIGLHQHPGRIYPK